MEVMMVDFLGLKSLINDRNFMHSISRFLSVTCILSMLDRLTTC